MEQHIHQGRAPWQWPTINNDGIHRRINRRAKGRDALPIYGNAPLGNERFCFATRGNTGLGDDFLQPCTLHDTFLLSTTVQGLSQTIVETAGCPVNCFTPQTVSPQLQPHHHQ
jgi:hypothetical protein